MAGYLHTDFFQQALGYCSDCYTHGRFTRRRTLQRISQIVKAVFHTTNQVRMARAWFGNLAQPFFLFIHIRRAHNFQPLLMIQIRDIEGNRAAHGQAMPNPRRNLDLVAFNLHTGTASVPTLTTLELSIDIISGQRKTSWHSLNNSCQTWSVGFSCC